LFKDSSICFTFSSISVSSSEQKRRNSREVRLFVQAVLQDSAFLTVLIFYIVISSQMHTKWGVFFTTTFAWEMLHTLDGMIIIACNEELRTAIIHPFSSTRSAVVVIGDATSMKNPRTSRVSPNK
uniref:7TM GPCR serpentine receptor class x (Srx) domain-containing protein n=1 Tax=Parascaris univalens TaxID=6257 RepID=A0A915ANI1_PARUN